jgi:hypothetical protein
MRSAAPNIALKAISVMSADDAREARARAWSFAFQCLREKKATRPGGPDDAKGSKHDRATEKYTG